MGLWPGRHGRHARRPELERRRGRPWQGQQRERQPGELGRRGPRRRWARGQGPRPDPHWRPVTRRSSELMGSSNRLLSASSHIRTSNSADEHLRAQQLHPTSGPGPSSPCTHHVGLCVPRPRRSSPFSFLAIPSAPPVSEAGPLPRPHDSPPLVTTVMSAASHRLFALQLLYLRTEQTGRKAGI